MLEHLAGPGQVEAAVDGDLVGLGQRRRHAGPGLLRPGRGRHPGVVDPVQPAGQPLPGRGGGGQTPAGQPPVVVGALLAALGLAVPDDDEQLRRAIHTPIVPWEAPPSTLGLVPQRPVSPVPAGTLCVIGGGEDRTGSRVVLREFIRLSGGDGARIAVVATASSLGDEILDELRARRSWPSAPAASSGCARRAAPRPTTPTSRPSSADVDAVFMTGGNQLKLTQIVGGTAVRRRGAVGVPARCPRRRHVGGRERRQRAHDRLRRRVGHPAAGRHRVGRRPRPAAGRGRRPALRAAQPLRPAAVAGRPLAAAARPRRRRGHRGRRSAAGACSRSSAPAASSSPTAPGGQRRAHRRARRAAAGVRRRGAHPARRVPGSTCRSAGWSTSIEEHLAHQIKQPDRGGRRRR